MMWFRSVISVLLVAAMAACSSSSRPSPPSEPETASDLQITVLDAPGVTSDATATFSWALTGSVAPLPDARWSCGIDEQPPAICNPPLTVRVIGDGRHVVRIAATITAATAQPEAITIAWWLDTTTPTLLWQTPPPALTTTTSVSVAVTVTTGEPGTISCALDDMPAECDLQFTLTVTGPGSHTLDVRFCDLAGNCSALSAPFRVDAAPDTVLSGCPAGLSSSSTQAFALAAVDNGTVTNWNCRLDDGNWYACGSSVVLSGLATGSHTFDAAAVDEYGLVDPSPARCTWSIDLPPETWIVYRPSPRTPLTAAVIEAASPDSDVVGYTCTTRGIDVTCPARSDWTVAPGAASTVTVAAVDAAGLADPTTDSSTVSWQVVTTAVTTWTRVAVGETHACALRADDSLWCWGANESGQLGVSSNTLPATTAPLLVTAAPTWTDIAPGHHHSCAISGAGTLWCWGVNVFGEVGTSPTGIELPPTSLPGAWQSVCASRWHTCAIDTGGTAWCWGYNPDGRLGTGDTTNRTAPALVASASAWQQLACGGTHTCGLAVDGTVSCWGGNAQGQVAGNGDALQPRTVELPATATAITAGGRHSCALLTDGRIYCWGDGTAGQLGVAPAASTVPVHYAAPATWTQVAAGGRHTCGIDGSGSVACVGDPQTGVLGYRPLPPGGGLPLAAVTTPVAVGTESSWTRVAAGETATCGIRDSGTLWCWGQGDMLPNFAGDAGFSPVWVPENP